MSLILDHDSECVMNFLENCMFVPHQMQIEQFIPWPSESTKEIIFPCHTSVISNPLLLKAIGKEMEWAWPLNLLGLENKFKSAKVVDEDYDIPYPDLDNHNEENGFLMEHNLIKATSYHE